MTHLTEWDHRAPTLAEQVDDLRANWDGPRCPHGVPVGAPGPDLICGRCEAEESDFLYLLDLQAALDAGEGYPNAIGPDRGRKDCRVRLGIEDRTPAVEDDGLPF